MDGFCEICRLGRSGGVGWSKEVGLSRVVADDRDLFVPGVLRSFSGPGIGRSGVEQPVD